MSRFRYVLADPWDAAYYYGGRMVCRLFGRHNVSCRGRQACWDAQFGSGARLPCGSLRYHQAHGWVGQSTGGLFRCPGHGEGR